MNTNDEHKTLPVQRSTLYLGLGVIGGALLFLAVFLVLITGRGGALNTSGTAGAVLYLDGHGRIDVGGVLQADGPAGVPVKPGTYTITFLDAAPAAPSIVTITEGEFRYVPLARSAGFPSYAPGSAARLQASVFPPNALIEIPDCQGPSAPPPRRCRTQGHINQWLLPGTYTVRYQDAALGAHEETITLADGEDRSISHSFIATVAQWDAWRAAYGHTLPRPSRSQWRSSGAEDVLLLPFWAAGQVVEEIFD